MSLSVIFTVTWSRRSSVYRERVVSLFSILSDNHSRSDILTSIDRTKVT